jgi:hypothetical protein
MKLPDFTKSAQLISIKVRMGIAADHLASFSATASGARLTEDELDRLTSGTGLDVSFEEIVVLDDGTLAYKGRRVLLYIRDVNHYGRREGLPKYHLSNCNVLQDARRSGRFGRRYVIANRTDGIFQINMLSGGRTAASSERLNVCQVCLSTLRIDGFSFQIEQQERRRRVKVFSPQKFFDLYPIDLHTQLPQYGADEAPLNKYSDGFRETSTNFKASTNWHCQMCGLDLSAHSLRKFLHTHHRNGDKSDDMQTNLRALCVECHAKEPEHSHMKSSP